MSADRETLLRLAERVEACIEPTRELADEVLLASGWRLNHDAEQIAQWRVDPGVCEGEDGEDYPVTLADRMNWSCWYKPGNRPFRDTWIDGHYRPNPLDSLDAAMRLVNSPFWMLSNQEGGPVASILQAEHGQDEIIDCQASTPALALTAAALRARAAQSEVAAVGQGEGGER